MHAEQFAPLILIFVILIVAVFFVGILRTLAGRKLAFERIEKLFTPAERSFLGVLDQAVGDQYRIFGKIRLGDIIRPPRGVSKSVWATAKNRIDRKHIDFAICDRNTLQVIAVIELDDSSHAGLKRQRTDKFVGEALTSAGVPVVRIPAQRGYAPAEIRERISQILSAKA